MGAPGFHGEGSAPTVWVGTRRGIADAREASDLIAKLSGKAYWRKIFADKKRVDVEEARMLCREIDTRMRRESEPLPFSR